MLPFLMLDSAGGDWQLRGESSDFGSVERTTGALGGGRGSVLPDYPIRGARDPVRRPAHRAVEPPHAGGKRRGARDLLRGSSEPR